MTTLSISPTVSPFVLTTLRPMSFAASTAVGDPTTVPAVVLSCAKLPLDITGQPNINSATPDANRRCRFITFPLLVKKKASPLDDAPNFQSRPYDERLLLAGGSRLARSLRT